jgi:hypothetical protein
MFAIPGLLFSSFAGVLLWSGAVVIAVPSHATALAAETPLCHSVAPTFAPARAQPRVADAKFAGGARLRALVAAPCPRGARAFDV